MDHGKQAAVIGQDGQDTAENFGHTGRTVQAYIDETPVWPDGTRVPCAPLTGMQWRIWLLATAGKFFEGFVIFLTGVALPLLVDAFGLGDVEKGLVGAAPLFGILLGALVLGGMADRYGRKRMFIAEMALFTACLIGVVASPGLWWLLVSLFGLGAALGCDYPTAHCMISESIASANRGRLVLSAFAFQAVGALFATAVGYLVLDNYPQIEAWRYMYATAIVPAVLVMAGRFFIPDSGHWLASRGRIDEAQQAVARLLQRKPPYPRHVRLAVVAPGDGERPIPEDGGYRVLFGPKIRRATILASVPWLLQDLGTYGIGIFTPVILATVLGASPGTPRNVAEIIHADIVAAEGAAFLDLLLLCGMGCAIVLADLTGRIRLQIVGFIGCALGLVMAACSLDSRGNPNLPLLFCGFMLFNFMVNCGPNAMTYLIAGEVFPTAVRGKGAGLAASIAKVGAVLTAFLFPILLADIGIRVLLLALAGTSLLGALVTWRYRIETTGFNLERLGRD